MVMPPVALLAERRQIQAIIRADPVSVVLTRRTKIPTPDNSYVLSDPEPVYKPGTVSTPQTMAMIPFKRRLSDPLVDTEIGDVEVLPYTLVCAHDADIKRDDEFELNGNRYVVKWLDCKTQVRITAGIDYLGGDPRG